MKNILIYLREAPGLTTVDEQQATLLPLAAGADPGAVFLDRTPRRRRKGDDLGLPERNRCTAAITPGVVIHVAEIGVIGDSLPDAMAVLEAWTARGASVHVAQDDLVLAPGDGAALWRAAQRIEYDAAMRRTAAARTAQMASARQRRDTAPWKQAKKLWAESWGDYTEIAAETGISESTLRRAVRDGEFPERKPKARAKKTVQA